MIKINYYIKRYNFDNNGLHRSRLYFIIHVAYNKIAHNFDIKNIEPEKLLNFKVRLHQIF